MTPLTLTMADYARIMPLATGQVQPDGVDLRLVLGRNGAWTERAEMLRRALEDPSVQGGEASMGVHIKRIDAGDRSFVALPVFVLRNFTARDLYVRHGSPLTDAAGLSGKRIGMYSWTASGSIWYRHFLRHAGVDMASLQWVIGDVDTPWSARAPNSLPANVTNATAGQSLSDMLLNGDLDAIYSPPRPLRFHPSGPIVRLYPDPRAVEQAYFRSTGVFPPQHLVVLRRAAWEADKSLARRVTEAFAACETMFRTGLRSFPYASPWLDMGLDEAAAVMGDDAYRHGLEENRTTVDLFAEEAHRLGLTGKRIAVDDYFAEYLES